MVTVDLRAEVTPEVLERIRELGGKVLSSVERYRAIRAEVPLSEVEALAAHEAVRSIRTADKAMTRNRRRKPSPDVLVDISGGRVPHHPGRRGPSGQHGPHHPQRRRHRHRDRGALGRNWHAGLAAGLARPAGPGDRAGAPAWRGPRGNGHARDRPRPGSGRRSLFRDGLRRAGCFRGEHRGALRGRSRRHRRRHLLLSGSAFPGRCHLAGGQRRSGRRLLLLLGGGKLPATRTTAPPESGRAISPREARWSSTASRSGLNTTSEAA